MNNCPKFGLIQGLHFSVLPACISVLPACKCQWQETPNCEPVDYMYINWDDSKEIWYMTRAPFSTTRYKVRIEKVEKF